MLENLRENWHQFKASEPGCRFQDRFHRTHPDGHRFSARSVVHIVLGVAMTAAGLVMMVAPGPGIAGLVLGLGLIAGESLALSRALDWTELRLRAGYEHLRHAWIRLPLAGKLGLTLALLAAFAAGGYGLYHLTFGPS